MELKNQKEDFKEFFLLAFTKELIKSYIKSDNIIKLKIEEDAEIQAKKELAKEKAREMLKEIKSPLKLSRIKQLQAITEPQFKPSRFAPLKAPRRLLIPRQKFPQRLQYIKPVPTAKQINLKKLNPMIRDPLVKSIECNGADENIVVKTPIKRITRVILNEEEINEIIKIFSKTAKIPISQGVFRVAIGNLVLSAIISEVIGTKFIIKKMGFAPKF